MLDDLFKKYVVFTIIVLLIEASLLPINVAIIAADSIDTNDTSIPSGRTIYVDDNSECPGNGTLESPYCKIQYGIDNATDGDTVSVFNGTYFETLIINKTIHLHGAGDNNTTIYYDESNMNSAESVIHVNANNCIISGFKIISLLVVSIMVRGIYIISSNNTISDNIILNSTDGIFIYSAQNNSIFRNTILNNDYGIVCMSAVNNSILDNNISSNSQHGISAFTYSNNNMISRNIIVKNYQGIRIKGSKSNTVFRNRIENNHLGVHFCCGANDNTVYYNTFIQNSEENAWDGLTNQWNYEENGNYWSDYTERYPNASKIWLKGIWNTPYDIPGGDNVDRYPLINPPNKSKEEHNVHLSFFSKGTLIYYRYKGIPKPIFFSLIIDSSTWLKLSRLL